MERNRAGRGYVKGKGVWSYARLESGKLLIWYDKTMNALIERAKENERKIYVV